jgi:hypothetical protein
MIRLKNEFAKEVKTATGEQIKKQKLIRKQKKDNSFMYAIVLGVAIGVGCMVAINWFTDNYKLRTPVIFQSPIVPITTIAPTPRVMPKKAVKTKSSIDVVGKVQASETVINPAKEAIYIYFGNNPVAYAVARAESGYNCKAISKTSDYGLFQIHLPLHQWRFDKFGGSWDNCWDNARVAYEIQSEQGWNPWSVFTNGNYKLFLNEGGEK